MKNNLNKDFEILYRPHPMEYQKFKEDFYPNFCIEGVKVINADIDVKPITYFSDFHISNFQGVTYHTLINSKKLVIPKDNFGVKNEMNIDIFKEKEFPFWANIFKVSSWEEFKKLVDMELLEQFINRYDTWWNDVSSKVDSYDRDLKWSLNTKPSEHSGELLKYFDDFNDQNASFRLIEKIEKMTDV